MNGLVKRQREERERGWERDPHLLVHPHIVAVQ